MNKTEANYDELSIREVFESWYRAMEDGDLDMVTSLVTDDVIVKPPDAAPVEGRKLLRLALGAFLETHSETVEYDIHELEVSGSLAFARLLERAAITPRSGGDAALAEGIHFTILRRQPDGAWLIARDISSLTSGA